LFRKLGLPLRIEVTGDQTGAAQRRQFWNAARKALGLGSPAVAIAASPRGRPPMKKKAKA
jgi:hypothetical protein